MHVGCCHPWLTEFFWHQPRKTYLWRDEKGSGIFRAINNYDWSWYREALAEFAEMKAREEKKARLEQEEKRQAYLARKMHYLLSTSQVNLRPEQLPWAAWGPAQQRLTSRHMGLTVEVIITQTPSRTPSSSGPCSCASRHSAPADGPHHQWDLPLGRAQH